MYRFGTKIEVKFIVFRAPVRGVRICSLPCGLRQFMLREREANLTGKKQRLWVGVWVRLRVCA